MTIRLILFLLCLPLFAGCATIQTPQIPLDPKAELASLSSTVRVTVETGGKRFSADGYLLYRRPDRFRLTVLNPFGLTAAEVYLNGQEILYLQPGDKVAYRGPVADVPDARGIRSWRMIGWVMERVASRGENPLVRERDGVSEMIHFDPRGLVEKKASGNGDVITYTNYLSVGGVPVAETVTMTDREGDSVRIRLDEPEANTALEDSVFTPSLENYTVLPLSRFPTQR